MHDLILTTATLCAFAIASIFLVCFGRSKYIVFLYSIILFLFTGSNVGVTEKTYLIYSRGTGVLPIPIINLALIIMFIFFFLRSMVQRSSSWMKSFPPAKPMLIISFYFICYFLWGVAIGIPYREILSQYGVINVINMAMIVFILFWVIDTKDSLSLYIKVFLICLMCSALYGTVRYLFLGGDSANAYESIMHLKLKLTFQDIGQSILFGICLAYCILSFSQNKLQNFKQKAFLFSLALLSFVNIVFSYRRNAWIGMVLTMFWLIYIVKARTKMKLIFSLSIIILFILGYVATNRFTGQTYLTQYSQKLTIAGDFTDRGGVTFQKGRFSEIARIFQTILMNHPIMGEGPWGLQGSKALFEQFAYFPHSAIAHMLLKSGLLGLILFLWIFIGFALWWLRSRRIYLQSGDSNIICEAFFCGFLFTIPELLVGTPIIIFRHLQICGIIMSTIYIAHNYYRPEINQIFPQV